MIVWDCSRLSLYMMMVLFTVTKQHSHDNSQYRQNIVRNKTSDEPRLNNSRIEPPVQQESREYSAIIPFGQYEEDRNTLKNSHLVSMTEAHQTDTKNHEYKHIQKRQNSDLEGIIQQVFPQNSIQEYETNNDNAYTEDELPINQVESDYGIVQPRSSPPKVVVKKVGSRKHETNKLKRKILLKRLKSPMYRRSSQDSQNEQNSEELLHNILESIDQKNSENELIKNAFLTKTTTYNISKLHESGKNKSFLIEKLINYTTNIHMLHSENIPTNYTDAHSSVLQTVLHLGQSDETSDSNHYENRKPSDYSFDSDPSNDILGNPFSSDGYKTFENSRDNPRTPTEFLGGQYLHPGNKQHIPKPTYKNSNSQVSSDFVGGQFIAPTVQTDDPLEPEHLKNKVLNFIGGQFVEEPLDLKIIPSGSFNEDDATPSTETKKMFSHKTRETTGVVENETNDQPSDDKKLFKPNGIPKRKEMQDSFPRSTLDDGHNVASKAQNARNKVVKPNVESEEKSMEDVVQTTTIDDDYTSDLPKSIVHQSSHKNVLDKTELKKNNIVIQTLPSSSEEVTNLKKESFGEESLSTPIDSDLLSSENEEYVGNTRGILLIDPTTGDIQSNNFEYNPTVYTTNKFDNVDSTTTLHSNFNGGSNLPSYERDSDQVLGEASDIQQREIGSSSVSTQAPDYLNSEEPFSQEQNATSYTDEVMLYAGKTTVKEELPVTNDQTTVCEELTVDQTTQNYDTDSDDFQKNSYRIISQDSGEKNSTEICFPLSNKNNASLFDLISGKLYLEKNGKKVNLHLKGNPLKYCNSGTKICRLYFDTKVNSEHSISKEMLEDGKENTVKGNNFKSNHFKREISEEDSDAMKLEQHIDRIIQRNSGEYIQESENKKGQSLENKDFIFLAVNQTKTNDSRSDSNGTVKTEITDPTSIKLSSEQSILPVSFKMLAVQNRPNPTNDDAHRITLPINGERITLHNLDSPYQKFGYSGNRRVRKIHHKRDSLGHVGGACGCNNPLLLSPSPVPDFRHFVGKRLAILKNIVHTVKGWAAQDSLRS